MISITTFVYGILGVFGIFTIVRTVQWTMETDNDERLGLALMAIIGFIATGIYWFALSKNIIIFTTGYVIFLGILAILFLLFRKSEKQKVPQRQKHFSFN